MLTVQARATGRRRPLIPDRRLPSDGWGAQTLRQLIERVVREEVAAYEEARERLRAHRAGEDGAAVRRRVAGLPRKAAKVGALLLGDELEDEKPGWQLLEASPAGAGARCSTPCCRRSGRTSSGCGRTASPGPTRPAGSGARSARRRCPPPARRGASTSSAGSLAGSATTTSPTPPG